VQTNLDEHDAGRAEAVATDLPARLDPETVVVTLGRLGALGYTSAGAFSVQAQQVPVRHTHGAGAAFSGGLAHAYLTGGTARQAVEAGYVAGTGPLRSYWPDTPPAHQRPCFPALAPALVTHLPTRIEPAASRLQALCGSSLRVPPLVSSGWTTCPVLGWNLRERSVRSCRWPPHGR
jgi:hypothetical protein